MNEKDLLKHNEEDSIVRRPAGLSDEDWNLLIDECLPFVSQFNPLMRVMAEKSITGKDKRHKIVRKILGLPENDLSYQNWSHTSYRFFRHFCPENLRNALSHSGLPFALLDYSEKGFVWRSMLTFVIESETEICGFLGLSKKDNITILANGKNDVDEILISKNNEPTFEYFRNGETAKFGDTMYLLKKLIISNKPKGRKHN